MRSHFARLHGKWKLSIWPSEVDDKNRRWKSHVACLPYIYIAWDAQFVYFSWHLWRKAQFLLYLHWKILTIGVSPHPIHSYILWINAKTIGSFEFKFSVDIVKTIIIILRSVHFRLTYCSTRPIPISNGKSSNVVYIKAFQSLVLNRTIRQTNILSRKFFFRLLEFDSLWCVGPFSPFHQNVPLRIHFCVGKSLLYRWL